MFILDEKIAKQKHVFVNIQAILSIYQISLGKIREMGCDDKHMLLSSLLAAYVSGLGKDDM